MLVDEYQDTNALQAEIVALLRRTAPASRSSATTRRRSTASGPPRVRNILDFPERTPDATVVTLERNYRSTAPILAATNAIIAEAASATTRSCGPSATDGGRPSLVTCRDEAEQTDWSSTACSSTASRAPAQAPGGPLPRAAPLADLELELSRRNIPYRKYGGLRFIETAHVKDLVAFLRLAENPRDDLAALRVLGSCRASGPTAAAC